MCGIVGAVGFAGGDGRWIEAVAAAAGRLTHRGPDGAGQWHEDGVALAHRRLAVIDPSPEGRQPMASACGRYAIIFNGEIYNHVEVRAELRAHGVEERRRSDTAAILAAAARWGAAETLPRLNGMFAIALWDRERRRLFLARDRLGQKPLFYGRVGDVFAFASELRAFLALPGFRAEVDRAAVADLLRLGRIAGGRSILRGVGSLTAGHWMTIGADGAVETPPSAYWSLPAIAAAGLADPFSGTADAAAEALEVLLTDAVRLCLVADVPVGAFLSGGVDSSLVTALMGRVGGGSVRTFTVGFRDPAYDESAEAASVAARLGTRHHLDTVGAEELVDLLRETGRLFDEPIADPALIPAYVAARSARRAVTVCLSGDGGDELFGGYGHYRRARRLAPLCRLPRPLRRLAGLPARLPRPAQDAVRRWLAAHGVAGDPLAKLGDVLGAASAPEMYLRMLAPWKAADLPLAPGVADPLAEQLAAWPRLGSLAEEMMLVDTVGTLPELYLVKADRAAMAASLETRMPLLDHRVVELAWRLPSALRCGPQGKAALRTVLARHLPAAVARRPKHPFAVPLAAWLRGPLRDWAEDLLAPARLSEHLDAASVRSKWARHLSGAEDCSTALWPVLAFEAWRSEWLAPVQSPSTAA